MSCPNCRHQGCQFCMQNVAFSPYNYTVTKTAPETGTWTGLMYSESLGMLYFQTDTEEVGKVMQRLVRCRSVLSGDFRVGWELMHRLPEKLSEEFDMEVVTDVVWVGCLTDKMDSLVWPEPTKSDSFHEAPFR